MSRNRKVGDRVVVAVRHHRPTPIYNENGLIFEVVVVDSIGNKCNGNAKCGADWYEFSRNCGGIFVRRLKATRLELGKDGRQKLLQ